MKKFKSNRAFKLESGKELPGIEIVYHTYGEQKTDNVIWVFHALTANSEVSDWWSNIFGEGKLLDPNKYFIVCANFLGSHYGTTGPNTINPNTNQPYFSNFPQITIRDMVKVHQLLKEHLKIDKIKLGLGGSMGGYQLLEWNIIEPQLFEKNAFLVTSAKESAWGIAIHEAQRLAIKADKTWLDKNENAGRDGMIAARGIGMLTYRNYEQFILTQTDLESKTDGFKAASYISYQGEKLANRFHAFTYYILSKAMDAHDVSRDRDSIQKVLKTIKTPSVVIGIKTDFLCPVQEQIELAENLGNGKYYEIDSPFGHDGFLIEGEKINDILTPFAAK